MKEANKADARKVPVVHSGTRYDGDTFGGTINGGNNGGRHNTYNDYTSKSDEDEERLKVLEARRDQLLADKRAKEQKSREDQLKAEIAALEMNETEEAQT
ncbi:hypothetical protein ONZ45_g8678 [Pleurotus djamor]|nr:hypothetical protein ONZ45_g8678 [Pleurotus djamor]